ncbi:MAG: pyridoxal-phosphate dependent enzyme [Deltaproteobacteria bacterium]|nr:pyridoxal-phosphate dependent enzyme [Deltaproteobacteria bacterium]
MTDFNLRVYDNTLDMLSNVDNPTPIVRLNRCIPFKHTKVYAKLEWYNPFGAVKDRVAANLIKDAEKRGHQLQNLVEPTSGNTGMGLAMISNARGYHFTATLSKAIPLEKRSALRLFGTNLIELQDDLCPMPGQPEGAMAKAAEMGRQPGWMSLNQYANPANPEAHYLTTGPEIWRQTEGKITHFVAGLGTCGTITGTGRFLKEKDPNIGIFGAHPTDGHDIPGVRSRKALALTSFFHPEQYNGVFEITDAEAYGMCKRLILEESIAAGPTSGMALAAVLKAVPDEPGNICVVMFPDNAFKYMSSFRKHLPELFGPAEPAAPAAGPFAEQLAAAAKFAENGPDVIGAAEALERMGQGAVLVDVRNPNEVKQQAVPGALNVPLGDLTQGPALDLPEDLDAPLITFCAKGKRSVYGMLLLKAQGYRNVKSVYGGMGAWVEAGLPTKAGE